MRWGVVTLCVLAASVVLAVGITLFALCSAPIDGHILKTAFLAGCPILAATAAVPVLPYMLLCAISPFYRARAMTVLGVSSGKPAEGLEVAQAEPPAQP